MAASAVDTITSDSRPPAPSNGEIYLETDTMQTIVYDGSSWIEFPATRSSGAYYLSGTSIVLSTRPVAHFDASAVDGSSSAGNPADGTSFSGNWVDRTGNYTTSSMDQTTYSAFNPTFYASGDNNVPYFEFVTGTPHQRFYLDKKIILSNDFTVVAVGSGTNDSTFCLVGTVGARDDDDFFGGGGKYQSSFGEELAVAQGLDRYEIAHDGKGEYKCDMGSTNINKTIDGATRSYWFIRDGGSSDPYTASTLLYVDGNTLASNGGGTYGETPAAGEGDLIVGAIGGAAARDYVSSGQSDKFMDGIIYEIMLFDSALSTSDKNKIIDYIEAKYNAGSGGFAAQTDF